jgi:hypothetical protein
MRHDHADNFRVGDRISLARDSLGGNKAYSQPGMVKEVNFIFTRIRYEDNSIVSIPNHEFTKHEVTLLANIFIVNFVLHRFSSFLLLSHHTQHKVVNWSRTPYRQFQTRFRIPMEQVPALKVSALSTYFKLLCFYFILFDLCIKHQHNSLSFETCA